MEHTHTPHLTSLTSRHSCLNVFHSSPRPFYASFFSILLLMVSFWWSCRYGRYEGKPASHILLSQKLDSKEKQVINLDQDVQVCGYFWCMVDETPLYEFSLPCNIFGMGCIFFFFFFLTCLVGVWHTFFGYASFSPLLFLTCLVGMWHTFFGYASFISFCVTHTL